jgi:hypothetical protein
MDLNYTSLLNLGALHKPCVLPVPSLRVPKFGAKVILIFARRAKTIETKRQYATECKWRIFALIGTNNVGTKATCLIFNRGGFIDNRLMAES